jgi:hypothetical protein
MSTTSAPRDVAEAGTATAQAPGSQHRVCGVCHRDGLKLHDDFSVYQGGDAVSDADRRCKKCVRKGSKKWNVCSGCGQCCLGADDFPHAELQKSEATRRCNECMGLGACEAQHCKRDDGGSCGFSRAQCALLAAEGVEPWDDEAAAVLAALEARD